RLHDGDLPMIVAHVIGIPVEESVLQLMPAGAAAVTAAWIVGRSTLRRLRRRRPGLRQAPELRRGRRTTARGRESTAPARAGGRRTPAAGARRGMATGGRSPASGSRGARRRVRRGRATRRRGRRARFTRFLVPDR